MTKEEILRKIILIIRFRLAFHLGQMEEIEKAAKELMDLIEEEKIMNQKQRQKGTL